MYLGNAQPLQPLRVRTAAGALPEVHRGTSRRATTISVDWPGSARRIRRFPNATTPRLQTNRQPQKGERGRVSKWMHNICDDCWTERQGDRAPVRLVNAKKEICCFCGEWTTSGIHVMENPGTTLCQGVHDAA